MKITIKAEVKSDYSNEDEIINNLFDIVSGALAQAEDLTGITIEVKEVAYLVN